VRVGEDAPDFTLRDQHGQEQSLGVRRASCNVLIVFFPFAFTGVCAGELRELNRLSQAWDDLATDVLAISCDPLASLRALADRDALEIPLLSDFWPHGEVAARYGAFEPELGAAGRASFVVDRAGVIRWMTRSTLANARSGQDYLAALAAL